MDKIDVAFICDETYSLPTAVAITSLQQNQSAGTECNVFVLGVALEKSSVEKIYSLNSQKCKVKILELDLSAKQKIVFAQRERVTNAALLKFDLPNIFPEHKKILYLDSDVLVQKDLGGLFSTDVSECYAAVTKDILTFNWQIHLERLELKNKIYFNSGMMLLNLEKMRHDNIPEKLIDYRLKGQNHFMDQDALNVVFDGKVKFVSPYYNLLPCFFEWKSVKTLENFYGTDFPRRLKNIYKRATVLHFGDKKKPWIYDMGFFSKVYKNYYEKSPYGKTPLRLQRSIDERSRIRKFVSKAIHKTPPFRGVYSELGEIKKNIEAMNSNEKKLRAEIIELKKECQQFKNQNEQLLACNENLNKRIENSEIEFNEKIEELCRSNNEIKNSSKNQAIDFEKKLDEKYLHLHRRLSKDIQYHYYKGLHPDQYEENLKEWFLQKTGNTLNLDNPKTFNEKIQWLKLYDSTSLKTRLADKYLVREYVKEKIGEKYLIPLLGVYEKFDEICFEKLPKSFVLKANHGSGWNIVVKDKEKFDKKDARIKFNEWMNRNFAFCFGLEMHYKNIIPKILVEEYMENDGGDLYDYKINCFSGKPKSIYFMAERSESAKMAAFDLDWNLLPFTTGHSQYTKPVPKPQNLNEMLELAEKLSSGFCLCRVDFYCLNDGSIKFGEMTFTPGSGQSKFSPVEYDEIMGSFLELPKQIARNFISGENNYEKSFNN